MATQPTKYEPVEEFDVVDVEEPFLTHRRKGQRPPFSPWTIVLMTVVLTTTTICGLQAIFWRYYPHGMCMGAAAQKGFATEWGTIQNHRMRCKAMTTNIFADLLTGTIETELVTYTNAFRYNATGKNFYREFDPEAPQYVGEPSPEIDQAWDDLLYGKDVPILSENSC